MVADLPRTALLVALLLTGCADHRCEEQRPLSQQEFAALAEQTANWTLQLSARADDLDALRFQRTLEGLGAEDPRVRSLTRELERTLGSRRAGLALVEGLESLGENLMRTGWRRRVRAVIQDLRPTGDEEVDDALERSLTSLSEACELPADLIDPALRTP